MNLAKMVLLLSALLPMTVSATQVSVERARTVAENFLSQNRQTRSTELRLTLCWTGEPTATRAAEAPAYYVFDNADGGFVIVAGDDSVAPVLGYSFESGFDPDNMPSNLRVWMKNLQEFIFGLRARDAQPSAQTAARWSDNNLTRATERYSPVQHETAKWNQTEPFNMLCPNSFGTKTLTGCVATAAAIVMRWFRWPESGTGRLPDYQYTNELGRNVTIKGHALGHTYDWDNMPLEYNNFWTNAQKSAVAQLMYDCGIMSFMQYGTEGSGAYTADALAGLYNYMHYDKSATCMTKCVYPSDEWKRMLRDNILNFGPTIYDGYDKDYAGHCFVLDGYDEDGRFGINFGWGGYFNGYYEWPDFDEFVFGHNACMGLKRDEGGVETPYLTMEYFAYEGGICNGLEISRGSIDGSDGFYIRAGAFINYKGVFYGQMGFAHTDSRGNFKEVLPSFVLSNLWNGNGLEAGYLFFEDYFSLFDEATSGYYPFRLKEPVEAGDKLIAVYRKSRTDVWQPVPFDVETEGFVGAIELMPDEGVDPGSGSLDAVTSFTFDAATRIITIATLRGATVTMTFAGDEVESGRADNGIFTIRTADLEAGTYTLRIETDDDNKEVELKIDNKR